MLWANEDSADESWDLESFDIDEAGYLIPCSNIYVRKCYKTLADSIPKIIDSSDVETNVVCASDGVPEVYTLKNGRKPVYNDNIIGYYVVGGYAVAPINRYLVRCNWKSGLSKTMGNHLRKSNYMIILPMFVAKLFAQDNWYEKDVYFTTSDGGDAYTHDKDFLKSCLIYTCLSNQNKCLTFDGSDGRHYQNELCFDGTDPTRIPLALADLNKYVADQATALDDDETALLDLWNKIMDEAAQTAGYDASKTYGVYQITKELNTSHTEGTGKSEKTIYDYPVLNGDLTTLRVMLKAYYKSHITAKMFEYQLLK